MCADSLTRSTLAIAGALYFFVLCVLVLGPGWLLFPLALEVLFRLFPRDVIPFAARAVFFAPHRPIVGLHVWSASRISRFPPFFFFLVVCAARDGCKSALSSLPVGLVSGFVLQPVVRDGWGAWGGAPRPAVAVGGLRALGVRPHCINFVARTPSSDHHGGTPHRPHYGPAVPVARVKRTRRATSGAAPPPSTGRASSSLPAKGPGHYRGTPSAGGAGGGALPPPRPALLPAAPGEVSTSERGRGAPRWMVGAPHESSTAIP